MKDYAKCPVTGEPLTMDDIVPIKAGKVSSFLFISVLSLLCNVVIFSRILMCNICLADSEA